MAQTRFCAAANCGHAYLKFHYDGKCWWPGCACTEMGSRGLSPREVEIVRLLCQGKCTKDVANQLGIEVKTVKTHHYNAANKLGVHSMVELVIAALKYRLITLEECG